MKICSCDRICRSRTDSGIPFGLFQMISFRRNQPVSCSRNASLQGTPIKSFDFRPSGLQGREDIPRAGFFLSGARDLRFPLVYPSPMQPSLRTSASVQFWRISRSSRIKRPLKNAAQGNNAHATNPAVGAIQRVGIQSWPKEQRRNRQKPHRQPQNNPARMAVQRSGM